MSLHYGNVERVKIIMVIYQSTTKKLVQEVMVANPGGPYKMILREHHQHGDAMKEEQLLQKLDDIAKQLES